MIPSEIRQLKRFVSSLTAKTTAPLYIAENEHTIAAEVVVRLDPILLAHQGQAPRSDEVFRIPAAVSLDEAKRIVMERLEGRS